MMDEDAALVAACRDGDLDAFEALVAKYQKRMFNVALRLCGDYDDAAEVVQDAFVSAYRNIKGFKAEAKFSTWLTAITLNRARNQLKQMKARQQREELSLNSPIETKDGEVAFDPPAQGPTVLERMETQETRRRVQECINALEPEFREVIVLRDMQDFSYDEISDMLKVREGTVKSRLSRAREAVKDCLKKSVGTL